MEKIKLSKFTGLISVSAKLKELALKINEIIDAGAATKEVVSLLTQSGGGHPSINTLRSPAGVSITVSREAEGFYTLTHNMDVALYYPVVEIQNTVTKLVQAGIEDPAEVYVYQIIPNVSGSDIYLTCIDTQTGLLSDDGLASTPIKITFYKV
jgi:hypothetical protein